MTQNYVPILNLPVMYVNSLQVSNNATTPNTKVDIAAGQCRDSTNSFDIVVSSALTINAAVNGANGLDTGSFAASKVYAVYVIADAQQNNSPAALLSLSLTAPLMPSGYGIWRLVGYAVSDSSVHFLKFYTSGNNSGKMFVYDAPITVGTTIASATYADIDLSAIAPAVDNMLVTIAYDFVPNADGDAFYLHGANETGDMVKVLAPTAAKHVGANAQVLAQLKASKAQISYKTAAAIGSLAMLLVGFNYNL